MGAGQGSPDDGVTRGFLFADLRGYTELVERRGAVEATHLLERYRSLTREVVGRHGGAEIKTEGDSFYVVLPSASAAVRCGFELVAVSSHPPDGGPSIPVGVGIHAGEAVSHEDGFVGSAVNIAARICGVAGANELLASGTVRELARSVVSARFVPVGRRTLKGIEGQVELFRVLPEAGEADVRVLLPRRAIQDLGGRRWAAVAATVLLMAGVAGVVAMQRPSLLGISANTPSTVTSPPSSAASVMSASPSTAALPSRLPGSVEDAPLLSPGTYSPNADRDVASISISTSGWHLLADQPDALVFGYELGGPELLSGSLGISRISVVFEGPCPNDPSVLIGDRPDDLITWVTTAPQLQASGPSVALDLGLSGIATDATVLPIPAGRCLGGKPDRARLWQQGGIDVSLFPGSRIRFEALDDGSKTLAVVVISENPMAFSGFQTEAQRILNRTMLSR